MKIKIKLHSNSSQKKIERIDEDKFEVWIKEKPIENKANVTLIKFLKKYFNRDIKIIKGLKSKNKIIEVL